MLAIEDIRRMYSTVREQMNVLFEAGDISKLEMDYADARIYDITRNYLERCAVWEMENKNQLSLSMEMEILHDAVKEISKEVFTPDKPCRQDYSFHFRRDDRYMTFSSLEDLQNELKMYFTKNEIENGIVDRLTSFKMKNESLGYWTGNSSYQDLSVRANVFFPVFFLPELDPNTKLNSKTVSLSSLIGFSENMNKELMSLSMVIQNAVLRQSLESSLKSNIRDIPQEKDRE